jgi:hypothetical protein
MPALLAVRLAAEGQDGSDGAKRRIAEPQVQDTD